MLLIFSWAALFVTADTPVMLEENLSPYRPRQEESFTIASVEMTQEDDPLKGLLQDSFYQIQTPKEIATCLDKILLSKTFIFPSEEAFSIEKQEFILMISEEEVEQVAPLEMPPAQKTSVYIVSLDEPVNVKKQSRGVFASTVIGVASAAAIIVSAILGTK
jgi:hypothetical protein